jgi:hypothetical protein
MSALESLEALSRTITSSHGYWGVESLREAVGNALRTPSPAGVPVEIAGQADRFITAGRDYHAEQAAATGPTAAGLPEMWLGETAVAATDAARAIDSAIGRLADTFEAAGKALDELAAALAEAQRQDQVGRGGLRAAATLLDKITLFHYDGEDVVRAHRLAIDGIGLVVAGARTAADVGRRTASTLDQLAAAARAAKLRNASSTPLDTLVVTGAAVPSLGLDADNLILTSAAAARAAARLAGLDARSRRGFDALLAGASSPQERAYLMQALAAGYSLPEIALFDAEIHGKDPVWLRDHLTPASTVVPPGTGQIQVPVVVDGRELTQGNEPTCVAGAAILARARVDPLYALRLSTGDHPDDPAYDSGAGFASRLSDEQTRVYGEGRGSLQEWVGVDGVFEPGVGDIVNAELGPATGQTFTVLDVTSPDARLAALGTVERTVDSGVPVPLGVSDSTGAHELVIIGHAGDELRIYNPWGYTTWVNADAFVSGHMDAVGRGVPPVVDYVAIPKP